MIAVQNLCLDQGAFQLRNVSFTIPTGSYGVLMGKTGSGKTSILEAVAGLRSIASGSVRLADREVSKLPPAQRGVGFVPQDGALFRQRTVRGNLGFALEIRNIAPAQIEERVCELASWLGVEALLDRYPQGLSGGEAQRIALGRALAFHPAILLLDEPLSALDEETREQLMLILEKLKVRREVTVLHVTHQRSEAVRLGDVLLRVDAGRMIPWEFPGIAIPGNSRPS